MDTITIAKEDELKKELISLRRENKKLRELEERRRRTEEELRRSRDELVQSEKLSFAGRMAASVAHEIRNPLNIISMAVQQLHDQFGKRDPKKEYTQTIIKNIDRVSNLITEFVNAARPPRLRMQFRDINKILEEILKLIHPKIKGHKAEVIKELEPGLPKIRVDEEHLTQAFMNIITNACDAVPRFRGKIWVTSNRENNYVVVKIRNSGKPIPQKDMIRIFDPFFSTKRTGTGLGTSIAYGVIGSHGGTISVESNRQIGTMFTIRLPLQSEGTPRVF